MGPLSDLEFSAATDVGRKRSHNEDNFLVDPDLGLFVVADGMGGHAAGEVASAIAVRTVHEVLAAQRDVLRERALAGASGNELGAQQVRGLLEFAVNSASALVHAEGLADASKRGMGTTLSALLVLGTQGFVAHVGDSRIYMLRSGTVSQVTEDHTVARELVRLGMVSPDQLANIPRKNAITRAVGVYPHVEIDTMSFEVLTNDRFLLCSDGLAGYFDEKNEPIAPFLELDDRELAVRELIDFANANGGKDNITAVVVRIAGEEHTAADDRARRVALKREVLATLPLFSRLNDRQLMSVLAVAELESFEAGEYVMREGDPGDAMYVLLAGRLRVEKNGREIRELLAGEQIGEMALIRSNPRSASVCAVLPSDLVRIRRGDFFDILRGEPHAAVKLLWQFINVLADRLEQTSEQLASARRDLETEPVLPSSVRPDTVRTPQEDPFAPPLRPTLALGSFQLGHNAVLPGLGESDGPASAESAPRDPGLPTFAAPPLAPPRSTMPVGTSAPPPPSSSDALATIPPAPGATGDEAPAPPPAAADSAFTGGASREELRKTNPSTPAANRRLTDTVPMDAARRLRKDTMQAVGPSAGMPPAPSTRRSVPPIGVEEAKPEPSPEVAEPQSASGFRPTKQTVRLDGTQDLGGSLDEIRKQFRERLAAEREKEKAKKDP